MVLLQYAPLRGSLTVDRLALSAGPGSGSKIANRHSRLYFPPRHGLYRHMLPRHLARLGAGLDVMAPGTIEAYDGFTLRFSWRELIARRLKDYEASLL